jgi:hypothetical protein
LGYYPVGMTRLDLTLKITGADGSESTEHRTVEIPDHAEALHRVFHVLRAWHRLWVLRYRVASAEGRPVEHTTPIGLVQKFPKDEDAWREIDRLGIMIRINDNTASSRITFNSLAEHYLKADFGADAVRPKSENTTGITEHIVRVASTRSAY